MQKVQAYLKMIIITWSNLYETPDILSSVKPAVNTPNIQVSHSPPLKSRKRTKCLENLCILFVNFSLFR